LSKIQGPLGNLGEERKETGTSGVAPPNHPKHKVPRATGPAKKVGPG